MKYILLNTYIYVIIDAGFIEGTKIKHMNKPLSLLFLATLSCGAISLAAYVHKDENKKDINQTVKAEEDNILTINVASKGGLEGVEGSFNVRGATIALTAQKNQGSTPVYKPTLKCIEYSAGPDESGNFGAGGTFTFTDLTITRVTITATSSHYAKPFRYSIDGGEYVSGTWNNASITLSNTDINNSIVFYNADPDSNVMRIASFEFEYILSEDLTAVNKFVTDNMHTEVSFDVEGDGLCIDDKWYVDAKKELVKLTDIQIDIFKNNSYFAKYHERYLAWAAANHDTSPYAGNGIILSNTTTIDKKNDNIAPLIVAISSFSFSFVILCSMLYSYKKEN